MRTFSYDKLAATASILSFVLAIVLALWHPQSNLFIVGFVIALLFIFSAFILSHRDHKREISELQSISDRAIWGLFAEIATSLHRLSHDLRDRFSWLIWQWDKIDLTSLQDHAGTTGQHVCNVMADLLSYYVGKRIALSIKIMDNAPDGTEEVVTLARDDKSAAGRKIGDKHPVKDNTAFNRIRSGEAIWFAESDLIAESRAGRYHNTNLDWQQKYQSAIVVPIRRENLDSQTRSAEKFWLLGFLCADAKDANTFDKERMEDYVLMLMVASDAAYVYFDLVKTLKAKITRSQQNQETGGAS